MKAVSRPSEWAWGVPSQAEFCGKGFSSFTHSSTGVLLLMRAKPCCRLNCPKCAAKMAELILDFLNLSIPETTYFATMPYSAFNQAGKERMMGRVNSRAARLGARRIVVQSCFPRSTVLHVLSDHALVGRDAGTEWRECNRDEAMTLMAQAMQVPGIVGWPTGSREWIAPHPNARPERDEDDPPPNWWHVGRSLSRARLIEAWSIHADHYELAHGHRPGTPPIPLIQPEVFFQNIVNELDRNFTRARADHQQAVAAARTQMVVGGTRTHTEASSV